MQTKVIASGVVGFEGLSVGGEVTLDASAPTEIKDYNIGAQYQREKYIAAAKTYVPPHPAVLPSIHQGLCFAHSSEKANVLTASFCQFVNPRLILSSTFGWRLDGTSFVKSKVGLESPLG